MSVLLMWLEGPLQSWGVESRFGYRATLPFPTRSGLLGLLCCAAGRGGTQEDWLAEMAEFPQTIVAYVRQKKRSDRNLTGSEDLDGDDRQGVQTPNLVDMQMVGSGYDSADAWQNLLIPKTSSGKKAVGPGTKMTYREYLQDIAFACVLEVPEAESQALADALQAPVWDICLGRKCCVPSDIVGRGVFDNKNAALEEAARIAKEKERTALFMVVDGKNENGDSMVLNDVPVRFGTRKVYRDRIVTMLPFEAENNPSS